MSAVAENIHTEMPSPFVFTDSAAAKVAVAQVFNTVSHSMKS